LRKNNLNNERKSIHHRMNREFVTEVVSGVKRLQQERIYKPP